MFRDHLKPTLVSDPIEGWRKVEDCIAIAWMIALSHEPPVA
jgi:hypothetical protein